jgi:copper homeostasis protein (lipoprotein)
MRLQTGSYLAGIIILMSVMACRDKSKKAAKSPAVFKGLYSLGPELKSFKNCATGREYWVADSSKQLELQYWQLINRENKDSPVYIEAEGKIIVSNKSDDGGHQDATHDDVGAYDSTLVVTKLVKITKDIPAGTCD